MSRSNNDLSASYSQSIIEMQLVGLGFIKSDQDRRVPHHCQVKDHSSFSKFFRKSDCHRSLSIKFEVPQTIRLLIIHVCMGPGNNFLHKLMRLEAVYLVCHIDLVNQVIIAIQTCRICLVFRILDRYGRRHKICKLRRRIPCICSTHTKNRKQQKPLPLAQQVEKHIQEVDTLVL